MAPSTGAGAAGGTIDYAAGTVAITSWAGGVAPALTVRSLLTQVGALPMGIVHGRTPGSPLRPGTFTVTAVRYADGQELIATADANGNIDTADIHGWIDVNSGAFTLAFGRYVLDSSLSAEDKAESWYNVADVADDGYIWRPAEVDSRHDPLQLRGAGGSACRSGDHQDQSGAPADGRSRAGYPAGRHAGDPG